MCTRGPIIGYQCRFVTFVDDLEVKTASKDLVEDLRFYYDQISFLGSARLKFNRSQFEDMTDPCSRTGVFHAELNKSRYNRQWRFVTQYMTWQYFHLCGCCCSRPAALLKLDIRYKTLITYQTFDCIVKVKAEFMNKSKEYYNDNEDIAVMMFDINYGYRRWMEMMMRMKVLSPCLCFLPPNKRRLRWISSPTASHKWPFQFRRWIFVVS